jgi:hypothetical protein
LFLSFNNGRLRVEAYGKIHHWKNMEKRDCTKKQKEEKTMHFG